MNIVVALSVSSLHSADVRAQENPGLPTDIIPFPAPVVRLRISRPAIKDPQHGLLAVEHDGRVYSLASLLARLPSDVLDELDNLVPRSSQETWDLVVRRWPHLARAAVGL